VGAIRVFFFNFSETHSPTLFYEHSVDVWWPSPLDVFPLLAPLLSCFPQETSGLVSHWVLWFSPVLKVFPPYIFFPNPFRTTPIVIVPLCVFLRCGKLIPFVIFPTAFHRYPSHRLLFTILILGHGVLPNYSLFEDCHHMLFILDLLVPCCVVAISSFLHSPLAFLFWSSSSGTVDRRGAELSFLLEVTPHFPRIRLPTFPPSIIPLLIGYLLFSFFSQEHQHPSFVFFSKDGDVSEKACRLAPKWDFNRAFFCPHAPRFHPFWLSIPRFSTCFLFPLLRSESFFIGFLTTVDLFAAPDFSLVWPNNIAPSRLLSLKFGEWTQLRQSPVPFFWIPKRSLNCHVPRRSRPRFFFPLTLLHSIRHSCPWVDSIFFSLFA